MLDVVKEDIALSSPSSSEISRKECGAYSRQFPPGFPQAVQELISDVTRSDSRSSLISVRNSPLQSL